MSAGSTLAAPRARRIEERALNASGASLALLYDGWLLGYRPGPTKRLLCVNPFYTSSLPLAEKIGHCEAFYANVGLPALFRLTAFSEPAHLDAALETAGWQKFEPTLVMLGALNALRTNGADEGQVALVSVPVWVEATAALLSLEGARLDGALERARNYPLAHTGAVIRVEGSVAACGLLKLEAGSAGIFAVNTHPDWRRKGFARAIVTALLEEAGRCGAEELYLQVTASNTAAVALYEGFGFHTAYEYWYRGHTGAPG